MPPPEPMMRALRDFLTASSWEGSRSVLNDHPELLNFGPEVIDMVARQDPKLFYPGRARSEAVALLKAHRVVLVRCKEVGVSRAIAEVQARERAARQAPEIQRTVPRRREEVNRKPKSRRRAWLITAVVGLVVAGAAIGTFVLLHHPAVPGATAQPIAISTDGKTLASAGTSIYLWDVATRRVVATLNDQYAGDLAFSPDGKTLVTENSSDLYLWNAISRRVVARLTAPSGLSSPAFSPDGKMLAAAGADNRVYLWDVAKLRLIATLQTLPRKIGYNGQTNTDQITSIAFNPDSKILAVSFFGGTGSYENQPGGELWNIATRRIVTKFPSDDTGDGVVFSPDGKTVVIEDSGGYFLWGVAQKKVRSTLSDPSSNVRTWHPAGDAATYSPNGKTLATADGSPNNSVFLWDVATGRMIGRLTDPNSQGIGALAYIQDAKALAVSDGNGNIYLWDLATGHITATLTNPSLNTSPSALRDRGGSRRRPSSATSGWRRRTAAPWLSESAASSTEATRVRALAKINTPLTRTRRHSPAHGDTTAKTSI